MTKISAVFGQKYTSGGGGGQNHSGGGGVNCPPCPHLEKTLKCTCIMLYNGVFVSVSILFQFLYSLEGF